METTISEMPSVRGSPTNCSATAVRKLSLRVRLLPIVFFLCYLAFTIFLFACGPWLWPVRDGTRLYTFLVFAHLALLLGYLSAARSVPRGYYGRWSIGRIAIASLTVNLLLLVPTSAFRTGSFVPNIAQALADPGEAYYSHNALRSEQGGGAVEYTRIVLAPLLFLLLPITVFYWQRLTRTFRGLSVLSILGTTAMWIAVGTNKAVADLVLLTPSLLAASCIAGFFRLSWRRVAVVLSAGIIGLSLFLSFFTAGNISRTGGGSTYFPPLAIHADIDNFLVRNLPSEAKIGAVALAAYLTQGYYGLYLSLDKPFVPVFGVGNSMFLFRNAARLTGIQEIETMPYPMRIEVDGWDGYGNWSSIYPWIASDVSFPGTILIVFLIGRLFALAWLDTLNGRNPFAVATFAQFVIMLFYFSANNQVLQSGDSLVSFYIILATWLFTRKRYVWGSVPKSVDYQVVASG